jgi:hypothetical protein
MIKTDSACTGCGHIDKSMLPVLIDFICEGFIDMTTALLLLHICFYLSLSLGATLQIGTDFALTSLRNGIFLLLLCG